MKKKNNNKETDTRAALISDPFGINTLEIGKAQDRTDELELDQDLIESPHEERLDSADMSDSENEDMIYIEVSGETLEEPIKDSSEQETQEDLDRISAAVQIETAKHEEMLAIATADQAQEAAVQLAAQIAEDEAIAAQLQEEQKAQEAEETDPELLRALPKSPAQNDDGTFETTELQSCIHALLFMSDKPVTLAKLRDWLGQNIPEIALEQAISALETSLQSPSSGIQLLRVAGGFQLRTKLERAPLLKRLARVQVQRLSAGAMESLAIVAYKQPILKEEIDKIRGVDSSYFVRHLLDRKLIQVSGRSDLPGRPTIYTTTSEFLELFGLNTVQDLPPLREVEGMIPASESNQPEESPVVRQMRKLVGQMNQDISVTLKYDPKEDEKLLQEFRERVAAVPTTTPTLEEQQLREKEALLLAKAKAQSEKAALEQTLDTLSITAETPVEISEASAQQ